MSEPFQLSRKLEGTIVSFCTLLFLVLAITSAAQKSAVGDSMLHYTMGEWALGRVWQVDEPLGWDGTMPITALNVVAARLRVALTPLLGEVADSYAPPLTVIESVSWARLPGIFFGAATVLLVWFAARRWISPLAGAIAAFLAALEPNLIGNACWITTDMGASFSFFAGLCGLAWYSERPGLRRLLPLAAILGAAQLFKVTNLMLLPFAALVVMACEYQRFRNSTRNSEDRKRKHLWRMLRHVALAGALIAAGVVLALQIGYMGFDRGLVREMEKQPEAPEYFTKPLWQARPIIPAPYTWTLAHARMHNFVGHPSYFLGDYNQKGSLSYFPFAVLVKTPLPILILFVIGCVLTWRRIQAPLWIVLGGSLVFFLYFCISVTVNIGLRHVLPVYPAMLVVAGGGAAALIETANKRREVIAAIGAFGLWLLIEMLIVFPHYGSYFNQLVGGSYNGWKVLSDSNVDFDQDRDLMLEWAAAQDEPVAINPGLPTRGLTIIRALLLNGIEETDHERMAWLREHHEPIERPTPAVFIYRVE